MVQRFVIFVFAALILTVSAAAQPTASSFGVSDASGNQNTFVLVPVNITNVTNGPLAGIIFNVTFDPSVLNLIAVTNGDLTSLWDAPLYNATTGKISIVTTAANATQNGSTGSMVVLNFSVVGAAGTTSAINISGIQLELGGINGSLGTAPAKNATFRVYGPPSVTNPSANPGMILAGTGISVLNVTVVDDIAVDSVVINLTPIGGLPDQVMTEIDTNLFSIKTNTSSATAAGTYNLQVNATDLQGNFNNTVTIPLTITLRGDLNGNGIPADAGDLVLMKRASIGEIPADFRYDLNDDGTPADAGDLVLMKLASISEIIL